MFINALGLIMADHRNVQLGELDPAAGAVGCADRRSISDHRLYAVQYG